MSKTGKCEVTQKSFPIKDLVKGSSVRPALAELIRKESPDFGDDSLISIEALNTFRQKYLENSLKDERGELTQLEKEVLDSIRQNELMTENVEAGMSGKRSFGERLSDRIATFGGSWTFIIVFFLFILGWMAINVFVLVARPFDPYPFILLNLILSCIAAIQAPIIMMSQNRQEAKDRRRSEHDYKVNLKAELEIRLLHEKIDHLITQQHQRLLEIQQIQIDLMQDILTQVKSNSKTRKD